MACIKLVLKAVLDFGHVLNININYVYDFIKYSAIFRAFDGSYADCIYVVFKMIKLLS